MRTYFRKGTPKKNAKKNGVAKKNGKMGSDTINSMLG